MSAAHSWFGRSTIMSLVRLRKTPAFQPPLPLPLVDIEPLRPIAPWRAIDA